MNVTWQDGIAYVIQENVSCENTFCSETKSYSLRKGRRVDYLETEPPRYVNGFTEVVINVT